MSSAALPLDSSRPRAPPPLQSCLHCGLPLTGVSEAPYCCAGCRTVHRLLHDEGLERYYELGGASGGPVRDAAPQRDDRWLEALETRVGAADDGASVSIDVQGIRCTACVWLVEELFRRQPHGRSILLNPALGRVELAVDRGFDLRAFCAAVERFGYLFGPPRKEERAASDAMLVRAGVCIALAMNAMVLGAVQYFGLEEGPLLRLVEGLTHALGLAAVVVGAPPFFRGAWEGLRRGVLHLDLPIALGIALAFAGSVASYALGNARASYVDTVTVFIALMVLGRWLQERVVERNRRQLLASDGAEGILARRIRDGRVETVPCPRLEKADVLCIATKDLVPIDAVLLDRDASFSLDWISGESRPRHYRAGETVPAGAFHVGQGALRLVAETGFDESPLLRLLATPRLRDDAPMRTAFVDRVVRWYVTLVLVAAAAGFLAWLAVTGDAVRALEVATAVLVVTCPCGFGIATPLAYELAHAGLRRVGLWVRTRDLLDRAAGVRQVVFDKTGTLTDGTLRLADPRALDALAADERALLYDLSIRSTHPKSRAVARALEGQGTFRPEIEVAEIPGRGVEAIVAGRRARLGAPDWAAPGAPGDLAFSIDGTLRAALRTEETLRPDACAEIERLRGAGFEVWILSGDAPERVREMAEVLGVPADHAVGGASPEAKATWLERHDRGDALVIGDGINDSLVVERAHVSGTPAVDRPFLPSKTDFTFVTPGLWPIGLCLRIARHLGAVVRRNLRWAVAYNVLAVSLSWAGLMVPWLAAVLMPASSILILAATGKSLSTRSPAWKS